MKSQPLADLCKIGRNQYRQTYFLNWISKSHFPLPAVSKPHFIFFLHFFLKRSVGVFMPKSGLFQNMQQTPIFLALHSIIMRIALEKVYFCPAYCNGNTFTSAIASRINLNLWDQPMIPLFNGSIVLSFCIPITMEQSDNWSAPLPV